ncbi:MAG: RNA methyltransferase [Bacteroidales bacterium]|nr:MAG: RNA methyltransferase [Bacteroidales bacterium]
MLSKNSIKIINSLRVKKFRNEKGVFIAEGERLVEEILNSKLVTKTIYRTSDCHFNLKRVNLEVFEVSDDEMKRISGLSTHSNILALVAIPEFDISTIDITNSLTLALDGIQDPGNLGTIIRLADWFGIDSILCSYDTVDAFSPKVIQSCMGAISRVKVVYCNLPNTLKGYRTRCNLPIYGTFMEGENIYNQDLNAKSIVVMGNEGNGISREVESIINKKIHIPSFATNRAAVESLNVAMATAIVCSEFRRC